MTSTTPNPPHTQNSSPSPNKFSRLLKTTFGIGVLIGVTGAGVYYGFEYFNSQLHSSNVIQQQQDSFTRAEFERLDMNTSLIHVEAILGRGVKIRQSTTSTTYVWENLDGSKIVGEFDKNNLLIDVTQDNLK